MNKLFFCVFLMVVLGIFSSCEKMTDPAGIPLANQNGSEIMASLTGPVEKSYGNVAVSSGFKAGHFVDEWDLTACDLKISFTYIATGMVDNSGAHAWSELGVRTLGYGDFNPNSQGVWCSTDYDWAANTFDPDPPGAPTLDIDDKMILQRISGQGEGSYNLPSTPPNPWANHAVWFDRDGVDQWQAQMWGAIDWVTYNTGGTYKIILKLHATGATSGTAYMTINGEPQGFYDPNWHAGPADLMPAGMNFSGDMQHMQVFYGIYGYGATHSAHFNNIKVKGCLYWTPVDIDIKPGSTPNSINLKSKGVVPVAVLSTNSFDACTIDPATVTFAGADPVRWKCKDIDDDGDMDMLLHFKTQELNLDQSSTEAVLAGDTTGDVHIKGKDSVRIVH